MRFARFATLATLALTLLAAPPVAEAQQGGRVYRLGMLSTGKAPQGPVSLISAGWPDTSAALRAIGYEEGRNFVLEARFADAKVDRLPAFAAELVRLRVDLILTRGTPAARAAKEATATIPILFTLGSDPVEKGLVASYARPGGNLTGFMTDDLDPKRLEYLKRAVPNAVRIAVFKAAGGELEGVRDAASVLGVQVQWLEVRGPSDFARAFAAAISGRAQALLVEDSQWVTSYLPQIAGLAAKHKLPAIAHDPAFVKAGALLYFGDTSTPSLRAAYVDRILKGAKPADLPVIKPTTFQFVVNLKAAKALGLTIPPAVLARADEVIE
jgi:ABC-type uncharacterized transport system substrate-binding protein